MADAGLPRAVRLECRAHGSPLNVSVDVQEVGVRLVPVAVAAPMGRPCARAVPPPIRVEELGRDVPVADVADRSIQLGPALDVRDVGAAPADVSVVRAHAHGDAFPGDAWAEVAGSVRAGLRRLGGARNRKDCCREHCQHTQQPESAAGPCAGVGGESG